MLRCPFHTDLGLKVATMFTSSLFHLWNLDFFPTWIFLIPPHWPRSTLWFLLQFLLFWQLIYPIARTRMNENHSDCLQGFVLWFLSKSSHLMLCLAILIILECDAGYRLLITSKWLCTLTRILYHTVPSLLRHYVLSAGYNDLGMACRLVFYSLLLSRKPVSTAKSVVIGFPWRLVFLHSKSNSRHFQDLHSSSGHSFRLQLIVLYRWF